MGWDFEDALPPMVLNGKVVVLPSHHKFSMWWINNENCAKFIQSWVCTFYTRISCIENTFDIDKCDDGWNINLWMNKCHIDFASSNKIVCQMCFQCTIFVCEMYELWMNEFCMISIITSWNAKFVMQGSCTFLRYPKLPLVFKR